MGGGYDKRLVSMDGDGTSSAGKGIDAGGILAEEGICELLKEKAQKIQVKNSELALYKDSMM